MTLGARGSTTPLPATAGTETAFIALWNSLHGHNRMDALRHLVRAQHRPFVVTTDGGVIRCANCAFAHLFGAHCPDDLIGVHAVQAFVEPVAREATRAQVAGDCHEYLTLAHDPLLGLPFVVAVRPRPVVWDGRLARAAFVRRLRVAVLAPPRQWTLVMAGAARLAGV